MLHNIGRFVRLKERLFVLRYYTIAATEEYDEWYSEQPRKSQLQVDSRLVKIQNEGSFWINKGSEWRLIRT